MNETILTQRGFLRRYRSGGCQPLIHSPGSHAGRSEQQLKDRRAMRATLIERQRTAGPAKKAALEIRIAEVQKQIAKLGQS